MAYVARCISAFVTISVRLHSMAFCISLNFFKFSFVLSRIMSNIYFVYFTFNSYYYCYFSIYFILLNLFTFLSIVASTESCENTWRVSSYSMLFFNFSFRVLTFSSIYFFVHKSLWSIFSFSSINFCSYTAFWESAKLVIKISWLNLLTRFLCWFWIV